MKQDLYSLLANPSDDRLRSRSFRTLDPETVSNLLEVAPDDVSGAVVEARYKRQQSEPRVRCRQCRKAHWKANHREGFVIRLPDSSALLVGKACGEKHYGAKWKAIQDQFEGLEKRQRLLLRLDAILAAWPTVDQEILAFRRKPWLHAFDEAAGSFRRNLPDLHDQLVDQLTRYGPTLYREERVRDLAKELLRSDDDDEDEGEPIFTTHRVRLGELAGARFILASSSLEISAQRTHHALRVRFETLELDTDGVFDKTLRDRVRAFEKALSGFAEVIELLSEMKRFAALRNLHMMFQWAEAERPDNGAYQADERGISQIVQGEVVGRFPFRAIGEPSLLMLRQLIEGR